MLTARKGLDGHAVYGRVRNGSELLELLGVDGDDIGRDVRIQKVHGEGTAAAQLLQVGIPIAQLHRSGYSMLELDAATLNGEWVIALPDVQALAEKVGFASVETLRTCAELDFRSKQLDFSDIELLAELLPFFMVVSLE